MGDAANLQPIESISPLRLASIVLLIVCMALPVRFWVAFGPFTSISILDIVIIVGGIWLLLLALTGNGVVVGHKAILLLLGLPLIIGVLSLFWSQDVATSVRWTLVNAESLVAYLLAARIYSRIGPRTIMKVVAMFVTMCLAGGILAFLRAPGFEPHMPPDMTVGTPNYAAYMISFYARFSHPFIGLSNDFASALNCYVLTLFAWGYLERLGTYKTLAGLTVMAITFTLSRGVLIPMVVVGCIYILRPELRRLWPWLGGLLGLMALGILAYYTFVPEVGATLADRTADSNVDERMEKLHKAVEKVSERPLLGYGSGVTPDSAFELTGGAHNVVADMMLYFGVVPGFVLCFGLACIPLAFFRWISSEPGVRFMATATGFAVLSQLLVFLSETSFDAPVLRVHFYYYIGTVVALLTAMDQSKYSSVISAADWQIQRTCSTGESMRQSGAVE
jgi:O-antigen ligase